MLELRLRLCAVALAHAHAHAYARPPTTITHHAPTSKATGEPSLTLACGVVFAIKDALAAARADADVAGAAAGKKEGEGEETSLFVALDAPATVARVHIAARLDYRSYTLQ